jgi:DnaJ-domain-containing protein 1
VIPTLLFKFFPRRFRTRKYLRALERGDLKSADKILGLGIDSQSVLKETLLFGSEKMLQKLILSGVILKAIEHESPFKFAHLSTVEPEEKLGILLNSGADINGSVGPRRLKLINWAILQHDRKFFDFLLKAGADIRTADRNGLLPIMAAKMIGEEYFEKSLMSAGSETGPSSETLLEQLVINENLLLSELYQLLKWCVKNAGFSLNEVTLPQNQTIRLLIQSAQIQLHIELELLPDQQINLLMFRLGEKIPFSNLIPPVAKLDSQTLRGHVVTALKELAKSIQDGKFKAEQYKTLPPLSPEIEKSFRVLGISSTASEKEIVAAYRTLAKRYHPDVALTSNHRKMAEINRAYKTLKK